MASSGVVLGLGLGYIVVILSLGLGLGLGCIVVILSLGLGLGYMVGAELNDER